MQVGINELYKTFPFLKGTVDTLWQIDPFGSSATTPLLFGSDFKYALLNRIGDNIKNQIKNFKSTEFWWTNSLNPENGILTHVLKEHY